MFGKIRTLTIYSDGRRADSLVACEGQAVDEEEAERNEEEGQKRMESGCMWKKGQARRLCMDGVWILCELAC